MIRNYKDSDADAVIDLWLEASSHSHAFIDYAFWKSHADAMRLIYLPSARTFVYEESGMIKGFISMAGSTVAALFVKPEYQGAGIGKAFIEFACRSYPGNDLYVYKLNGRAVRFYLREGYRILEEKTDLMTGEEQYHMRHSL